MIITIVFFLFSKDLLLLFGASENTIDFAVSYMKIYSLGTIFVQLTLGLNAFISAQGFAKVSMMTVLIGAVCNIILDPIFIFVFKMGVSGAALATIISQSLSMIWILFFLTGKKTTLKIKKKNLRLTVLILLLMIGIGFAALAANLKIDGTLNVSRTSWDVHFENVSITEGSVTANPAPTTNNTDTTEMTYTINFTKLEFLEVKTNEKIP